MSTSNERWDLLSSLKSHLKTKAFASVNFRLHSAETHDCIWWCRELHTEGQEALWQVRNIQTCQHSIIVSSGRLDEQLVIQVQLHQIGEAQAHPVE